MSLSSLFHKKPQPAPVIIDNSEAINEAKAEVLNETRRVRDNSVERANKAGKDFDKVTKKLYDVAEKINLATGKTHV